MQDTGAAPRARSRTRAAGASAPAPAIISRSKSRHDEALAEQKGLYEELGYTDCSEIKDRNYFHSIYVRSPGGILTECAATAEGGFTRDEPWEELGTSLLLPPWFEHAARGDRRRCSSRSPCRKRIVRPAQRRRRSAAAGGGTGLRRRSQRRVVPARRSSAATSRRNTTF